MTDKMPECLGALNLALSNMIDKLPVSELINDRPGALGSGSVSMWAYDVELIEDDEGDFFALNCYVVEFSLSPYFDGGFAPEYDFIESDVLGDSCQDALVSLQSHKWLVKK